jgi:hypothetical protein
MMISLAAAAQGWTVGQPITLPAWDVLDPRQQQDARAYVARFQPDLLIVAWPCTVWSRLQQINQRTPEQAARLRERRQEQRRLLLFVRDIVLEQRSLGGAVLGESPLSSLAWQEETLVQAFEGLPKSRTDFCAFGLRRPDHEWKRGKQGFFCASLRSSLARRGDPPGGHPSLPSEPPTCSLPGRLSGQRCWQVGWRVHRRLRPGGCPGGYALLGAPVEPQAGSLRGLGRRR